MTADLSKYPIESPQPLRLDDVEVCKVLEPYIVTSVGFIEQRDLLVEKISITPEEIRSYVDKRGMDDSPLPDYVLTTLPRGLFARAVDLSAGPHVPFAKPVPPEEVKLWLGRLHRAVFHKSEGDAKSLIISPKDFAHVRNWLSWSRMDICSEAARLKTGYMGDLYENARTEHSATIPGRKIGVWISRTVPIGSIKLATEPQGPDWQDAKLVNLNESE